jgi:hypothetical protein
MKVFAVGTSCTWFKRNNTSFIIDDKILFDTPAGSYKDIIKQIATAVNGAQNVKGGVYRLGAFSIDWRWSFGEKTAASANGRKCGETISQNTGATFGADTKVQLHTCCR